MAQATITRSIHIDDKKLPISEHRASQLLSAGVVYECGDGHDLHIDSGNPILLTGAEVLALAVAEGMANSMMEASSDAAAKTASFIAGIGENVRFHTIDEVGNFPEWMRPKPETAKLLVLVDELCDAVDAAGADVGTGRRGSLAILNEIGPALDKAKAEFKDDPLTATASEDKVYRVGDTTMRRVFEPAGLRDMSDMQAVMDAVEKVLKEQGESAGGEVKGLPVAGYKPTQSQVAIDLVNEGKILEERVLRWAEKIEAIPAVRQGSGIAFFYTGRSDVMKGFMMLCRAVFQPDGSRIKLPEDDA